MEQWKSSTTGKLNGDVYNVIFMYEVSEIGTLFIDLF